MTPRTAPAELDLAYPFEVLPDPEGGFVVRFPGLPGCITQVDDASQIGSAAAEALDLWIETTLADGQTLPEPRSLAGFSGRFSVRIPKSLHRELARSAERDGISLNQYVTMLLSRHDAPSRS